MYRKFVISSAGGGLVSWTPSTVIFRTSVVCWSASLRRPLSGRQKRIGTLWRCGENFDLLALLPSAHPHLYRTYSFRVACFWLSSSSVS